MDKLILTGYSEKEFAKLAKKNKVSARCYLCKRTLKDKCVGILEGDSMTVGKMELKPVEVGSIGGVTVAYPLCCECDGLLTAYVEKALSKMESLKKETAALLN